MVRFLVDMRGLDSGQMRFVSTCLHQADFLNVHNEQKNFIKIEVSDSQHVFIILRYGTQVRKHLAEILNSWCQQRGDLFKTNSNYIWWTRVIPCS